MTNAKVELDQIEIRIVDSYSAADRLHLSGGDTDPSRTDSYHLQWRPKEQHVLLLENRQIVCHAGLVKHTVDVGQRPVSVAGIGSVLTPPECRNRGLGRIVMQKAEEYAHRDMSLNFGLLFCRPAMQAWYEGLGWSPISEPVWIEQLQETILAPLPVMVKCFGQEGWPTGPVRLGSFPW